jgi:hypothetical protein
VRVVESLAVGRRKPAVVASARRLSGESGFIAIESEVRIEPLQGLLRLRCERNCDGKSVESTSQINPDMRANGACYLCDLEGIVELAIHPVRLFITP